MPIRLSGMQSGLDTEEMCIRDRSYYTIGSLEMNEEVAQNVGKIALTTKQGKEDFDKAQERVDMWENKFASLNPEVYACLLYTSRCV